MKWNMIVIKTLLLVLMLVSLGAMVMQGKPEDSKKEKTGCITCHVKMGSKELNDTGKCYAQKRTLKDCKPGDNKAADKK